ncbi:AMIN-like domain-containing (lipo)protein [Nocardioides currus]|uniref:AMIN-like domain-containing (lipo)protein n=1 Tax=Nocardioides currus TaxID=2133958 RepID=UPI0010574AEF|nr:hypothetical protein [Nocardioides currus]
MHLTRSTVAATAVLLALAGCSDDSPASIGSPKPSASPSSTPSSPSSTPAEPTPTAETPTPTTSPPSGFSLDDVIPPGPPKSGGYVGAVGTVRVGHHPDFDRAVWQFRGRGKPVVVVRYVDEPLAEGSGDRIDIRGEAYLQVDISRVGIPPVDQPAPANASDESLAGTVIADARAIAGGFEGYGQSWIGVRDRPRPFRVMVLKAPTRIVVDVYSG